MFKQGDIVKSILRTENYPLFLLVLYDKDYSETQFNAVVIKDLSITESSLDCECVDECFCQEERKTGFKANNWNTCNFVKVTWDDVKPFL